LHFAEHGCSLMDKDVMYKEVGHTVDRDAESY